MASKRTDDESDGTEVPDDLLSMPATAYLVLGVLSVTDERLTAGEIKVRAEHTIGRFYWSPAVSHIRRELTRLLAAGLVAEQRIDVGARSMTVHEITEAGETLLSKWASALPESDVVVKHPLMLRIWLSRDPDPSTLLEAIDRYIERVELSIQKGHWGVRRAREVGIPVDGPATRYSWLVGDYSLRFLYAELSNVRQLRDEIAWMMSEQPPQELNLQTTQLRKRQHPED